MTTIRVLVKSPGGKPETREISKGLEPMQEIVGGYITTAYLPELDEAGITLWANDEGLIEGLEPNIVMPWGDIIVGTIFLSGHDEEGDTTGLSDDQLELAKAVLNQLTPTEDELLLRLLRGAL